MPLEALLASLRPGGRDFEHLCKWLLENVPEYERRLKQVWLWDEWPGGGSRDIGIDLVAEDRDGGLWAIQAKHYDPAYSIKKADLDSFLSASSRAQFTYRLLIATTDHVGPNARSTFAIQEKPVGMLLRSQLDAMEVAWPTSITRLRPVKAKRKRPRPHQRRAIKDCVQGLTAADRGQLVMACGTGKTLVGPFLAERMGAKRVLVLVPSLSLLGQTLREWATAIEFDYLAVCSDETVTKDEQDAVVASTSELGIPVTTDAERIANFLRRRGDETKVVFSTYQSSPQIAAAQANRAPAFDLVIADEAHRCTGPLAGVFAAVLDQTKVKAKKRMFMTATPRYFTGRVKKEAEEADWEVASMDEEAKFGSVLHRLTFAQAIDQDLLANYQVVVVGVTDSEAHELAARGAFVTRDGKTVTDARTLARQIGLLRAMAKHGLHRIVTFHSRIDSASRFASSLPETNEWIPARRRPRGKLWTDHVSGTMTAGERDAKLRRLKDMGGDERGVLTNARCLTEGVDVPTLDGVAFIDPRRSQIDVVQAVGRAIRKAEDKSVGTIVVPVLVDTETDPGAALLASEFDRVWQIVRALRDHDEDLAEEIDELRRELGRRGSIGRRPSKIVLDLPVGIGMGFARAFDTRLVERSTSSWEEGLGAASAYHDVHGDLRVPQSFVAESGLRLGTWVGTQRAKRTGGQLSPERIAALDAIDMIWDAHEDDWRRALDAAREYRDQHGDLLVPYAFVNAAGFALGEWLGARRVDRNRGTLSARRIGDLDSLGMFWDARDENWQRGLAAARAYREVHGDLDVPSSFVTTDSFKLGSWITARRARRRQGTLSPNHVAALDALGLIWNPADESWQRGIGAARAYHENHSDLGVPVGFVTEDGFKLGAWISNQRTSRNGGKLSPERIAALDALDMSWDAREASWQRGITAARAYRDAHGDLMVPVSFITNDGFTLGRWIFTRRRGRRTGALSPERVAALDDLDMVWDPLVEGWELPLAAAHDYRQLHGHLRVPTAYETDDGFRLGGWITEQRGRRRRSKLSSERIAALDALDMIWDARDENWQRGIDASRNYREQYGDLRIPQAFVSEDGFKLGLWISQRRTDASGGKLSPERIAALDALGMIWTWNRAEDAWQRGLAAARAYHEEYGDLRVTKSYVTPSGFRLGGWVNQRRTDRAHGKLSSEQVTALDALGMSWNVHDRAWQRGIAAARVYREEHDHLRVPAKYVTHDRFRLGAWISNKRADRARGKLSDDRIAALDAVGMTWDLQGDDWERAITAARAYREAHGHLRVPAKYVAADLFALGGWIWMRRADRARGKLPPERIAALDALGMTWDPKEDDWLRGIAAARAYREAKGNLRVPQSFVDDHGFRLGSWIANRRSGRKRGVLSTDRIATLDELDMVW